MVEAGDMAAERVASEEAINSERIRELKVAERPSRVEVGRAGFEPAKA
jgi:hypothetical protein